MPNRFFEFCHCSCSPCNCSTFTEKVLYSPSIAHQNAQRANAFAEMITQPFNSFLPGVEIPKKTAEALISLYAICQDIKGIERAQHSLLFILAAAELSLAITLLFQEIQCNCENTDVICTSGFLLQLIYTAVLGISWSRSEVAAHYSNLISKQEAINSTTSNLKAIEKTKHDDNSSVSINLNEEKLSPANLSIS